MITEITSCNTCVKSIIVRLHQRRDCELKKSVTLLWPCDADGICDRRRGVLRVG